MPTTLVGAMAFQTGDTGEEVVAIQKQLVALGYDVVADGDFGPATVEAIKAFQLSQGMEVDGLVGKETYFALMGRNMPPVSRGSNYIVRRLVQNALECVGTPYVFGGSSPAGFDCSGFVRYVFLSVGISLPRAADEQYNIGVDVDTSNLRTGDLVFFSTYESGPSHVGIYLRDDKFINASSSRGVVIDSLYDSYWSACYLGAKRII